MRTSKGLPALVVLAALLLALGLAACGGGDSSSSTSGETENASAAEGGEKEEVSAAEKEQVSVAMELILTGQAFGQEIQEGAEAFAAEDGAVDLETNGPPQVDPETAQKQATDLLAKQPDAMGFAPFPPELWTRTAKMIDEQVGPNVLIFNERPASEEGDVSAATVQTFVGAADKTLAREATELGIEGAGLSPSTTGEVIIGQCIPQEAGVLAMRTEGVKEVVSKMLPKAKQVVFTSGGTPQESLQAWTSELAAKPNPAFVIGVCTEDGGSIDKVMKEKGYDFPATAMDVDPGTIAGIKDGNLIGTVTVNWWLEGYTSARMLTEAARGGEIPEGWINTGQLAVTKKNIAELEERTDEPEKFYAPQIEELFAGGMPKAEPIEDAYH
jgi:ABC-type sugar transport system substrate-binding protein